MLRFSPHLKALTISKKTMEIKAKQPAKWKKGKRDQKVTSTKVQVKATSAFQIYSSNFQ